MFRVISDAAVGWLGEYQSGLGQQQHNARDAIDLTCLCAQATAAAVSCIHAGFSSAIIELIRQSTAGVIDWPVTTSCSQLLLLILLLIPFGKSTACSSTVVPAVSQRTSLLAQARTSCLTLSNSFNDSG